MVVHLEDPRDPLKLAGCECPTCGYELKGVRRCVCPECGQAFSLDDVRSAKLQPATSSVIGLVVCALIGVGFLLAGLALFISWSSSTCGLFAGIGIVAAVIIPLAWHALKP